MIVHSMPNVNHALTQYTSSDNQHKSKPKAKPLVEPERSSKAAVDRSALPVAPPEVRASEGTRFDGSRFTAIVLLLATIASGMMLVYSRHQARVLFQQLEALSTQHDEQQIEWGRLQLEQATWSENSRIEQIARDRLGLDFPEQTKVVVIKQ